MARKLEDEKIYVSARKKPSHSRSIRNDWSRRSGRTDCHSLDSAFLDEAGISCACAGNMF